MNKIMIIICIIFLFGCESNEKEASIFHAWERSENGYDELLNLNKDGSFSYYWPDAGELIDDSDLCESFTYDEENNLIILNCSDEKRNIKIVSLKSDKLVLEYQDKQKIFHLKK